MIAAVLLIGGASSDALAKKKKHKKHKPAATKKVPAASGASPSAEPELPAASSAAPEKEEAAPSRAQSEEAKPSEEGGAGEEGGPPPKKTAKREQPAEAAPEEGRTSTGGLPALYAGVGPGALFRAVAWNQDVSQTFPGYHLSPGAQVGGWAEVYPAAFAMDGFLANIGLVGRFNLGLGVKSKTPAGDTVSTTIEDLMIGAKVRFPFGTFVPDLSVSYGMQAFTLASGATLPSVKYAFIRPGVGARILLSDVADITASIGYLIVTNSGTGDNYIQTDFPNMKAYGVDLGASFGYRFTRLLGVRAGAEFRQYGLAFHVTQADVENNVPPTGGATDRFITVWAGVEISLDGAAGGGARSESGENEAAPEPKKASSPADDSESGGGGDESAPPPKKAAAAKKKAPDTDSDDDSGGDDSGQDDQ